MRQIFVGCRRDERRRGFQVNSITVTNVTPVHSKFSRVFGFQKILPLENIMAPSPYNAASQYPNSIRAEAYPVVSGLSRCSSWVRTADLRGLSRWMMSQ